MDCSMMDGDNSYEERLEAEIERLRDGLKIIAKGIPGPCLYATQILDGTAEIPVSEESAG